MKTGNLGYILFACLAVLPGAAAASEEAYKKMAAEFARYSAGRNFKNIAIAGFSGKAMASREETEYVSEKLLSCLASSGKVKMLERSQLDKVLAERSLSAAGVIGEPAGEAGKIEASDAIIAGTIFGTPEKLNIIARMIDPVTGAVLHIVEVETDRLWGVVASPRGFDFSMPDLDALALLLGEADGGGGLGGDWRDAPADSQADACASRRSRLARLQGPAVDVKAKYWALQMRRPGYSPEKLQYNPGAEIIDKDARQAFYGQLERLHAQPEPPELDSGELGVVTTLAAEEKRVRDDCGLR